MTKDEFDKKLNGLIGVINIYQEKLSIILNFLHSRNLGVFYILFKKVNGDYINHEEFFLTEEEAKNKAMSMFGIDGPMQDDDSFEIRSFYNK